MNTMYIGWADNSPLELLNANMDEVAERYECIWDSEKGLLSGENAFFPAVELSEQDWFSEHIFVWFLFYHIPDSSEVEVLDLMELYCMGKDNPPYAVLYLECSPVRYQRFLNKGSESMAVYDFCRANGIIQAGEGLFMAVSGHAYEFMEALAGLLAENRALLFSVNAWQLITKDVRINMLSRVLNEGTDRQFMSSKDYIRYFHMLLDCFKSMEQGHGYCMYDPGYRALERQVFRELKRTAGILNLEDKERRERFINPGYRDEAERLLSTWKKYSL